MKTAPNLKARLMQEFSDYNEHFCKNRDSRLRIDIANMADNWETINQLFQKQASTCCIMC